MLIARDSWVQSKTLETVGHWLFFGSYFYLNNPFFALETNLRFGSFFVIFALGVGLILASTPSVRIWPNFGKVTVGIFSVFYLLAMLRTNYVFSGMGEQVGDSVLRQSIFLSMIIGTALVASRIRVRQAALIMAIVGTLCSLEIARNYQSLFDYALRNSFAAGNLQYDAYQTTASILSLSILALGYVAKNATLWIAARGAIAGLIGLFTFVLFQGLARGELVALSVALFILIFRFNKLVFILPVAFALAVNFLPLIDSPLTNRLSLLLEGNLGERDTLLSDGLFIILRNIENWFFGGGMNYFQYFHGLPSGLHPHNQFLEAFLAGGVFLFFAYAGLFIWPIVRFAFQQEISPRTQFAAAIATYVTLTMAKSGTIVDSWILGAFVCFHFILLAEVRSENARSPRYSEDDEVLSKGLEAA